MGTATHSARHKQNHSLKKVTRIDMGTATYSNIQCTLFLLDKMHCNREPRCYSGFDKIRLFMEITTPSLCHIWIEQLLCTRIPWCAATKKNHIGSVYESQTRTRYPVLDQLPGCSHLALIQRCFRLAYSFIPGTILKILRCCVYPGMCCVSQTQ